LSTAIFDKKNENNTHGNKIVFLNLKIY